MSELTEAQAKIIADAVWPILIKRNGAASKSDLDQAIANIQKATHQRLSKSNISISQVIRGLRIIAGGPALDPQTAEADTSFVRALAPGTVPGSYLIPTFQADEIIGFLETGGVLRSAGPRVWPMEGMQKLTVPTATAAPTWEWLGPNTTQTASDPNIGQLSFDLKTRRCLIAIPNELLASSVPQFDTIISELVGLGAAAHEDVGFFSTTSVANGFTSLYQAASTSSLMCQGSANGGNLGYSDIIGCMAKAAAVKAKPPFCWLMGVRTFYSRVLGLVDASSRPIAIPTLTQGLYPGVQFSLMGWPVYISPYFDETQSNGSGTNQSWLCYTNSKYLHIAQQSTLQFAVSVDRYFELNQTGVRAIQLMDFACAPPAGVVLMKGIN